MSTDSNVVGVILRRAATWDCKAVYGVLCEVKLNSGWHPISDLSPWIVAELQAAYDAMPSNTEAP